MDFAVEIWGSLKFFIDYMRGKPETRTPHGKKPGFAQAFGVEGAMPLYDQATSSGYVRRNSTMSNFGAGNMAGVGAGVRSYDYAESGMGVGAGPEGRNYNYSLANGGNQGGRDGSLEQYGENVRLTTFPPRNGTAAPYGNGNSPVSSGRDSEDTADVTYPQPSQTKKPY